MVPAGWLVWWMAYLVVLVKFGAKVFGGENGVACGVAAGLAAVCCRLAGRNLPDGVGSVGQTWVGECASRMQMQIWRWPFVESMLVEQQRGDVDLADCWWVR
ncbi:MAG: hypothetical protein FWD57_05490 [Polyangiaceae bacterium]|nr:hypothetical protein [Polyangiaceae bacterium]